MNHVNEILDELKGMSSPLADISRVMPYSVPQGYFVDLYQAVDQILEDEGKMLWDSGVNKQTFQEVPEGYFDEFPEQMLALARAEHIGFSAGSVNPLNVPKGYFLELPEQLLAAAKASDTKASARVIPLISRVSRSLRWAAAAILVMGIGFGTYQVYFGNTGNHTEKQLAKISSNTLGDYLQQNIDDYDMETLENTVASNAGGIKQINSDLNPKNLNTDEITQYLNETGWEE